MNPGATTSAAQVVGILNIGPMEIVLLVGAAILLFGGDLPEVARKLGVMLHRLRSAARDVSDQLRLADSDTERPPLPPHHGRRTSFEDMPAPLDPIEEREPDEAAEPAETDADRVDDAPQPPTDDDSAPGR